MKRAKDEAIKKIVTKYKSYFGRDLDSKVLLKKLNMKGRLKKNRHEENWEQNYNTVGVWEENIESNVRGIQPNHFKSPKLV